MKRPMAPPVWNSKLLIFVFCLLAIIWPTNISLGQSTDERTPAPLTSDEIRGQINPSIQQDSWFTFAAGPGELAVLGIAKKSARDNGAVGVTCKLYDEDTHQLISLLAQDGMDEVKRKVILPKQTRIKMHLETYDNGSPFGGSYRITLSGALALQTNAPTPHPSRGKLRVEFNDGSVQEFDMTRIRRLTLEP
jgi:hypothetical protein